MIHVDLPDGPASPLARLALCLSSVTEVPLTDLPNLGDASAAHLLGAYKSWLAGRNSGLVPIHDPRSFQWAGWWFATIAASIPTCTRSGTRLEVTPTGGAGSASRSTRVLLSSRRRAPPS